MPSAEFVIEEYDDFKNGRFLLQTVDRGMLYFSVPGPTGYSVRVTNIKADSVVLWRGSLQVGEASKSPRRFILGIGEEITLREPPKRASEWNWTVTLRSVDLRKSQIQDQRDLIPAAKR